MKTNFPYIQKGGQYFPVIDVKLQTPHNALKVKALIDSGASFSIFRPEIAKYLGIKMEQGRRIYLEGIGGRILGYLHKLTLTVGNKTFQCKVVFSPEFTVSFNLLGRDNFFQPFDITFQERTKLIIIADEK